MQNTIKKAKIKGMTLEGGWEEVITPENGSPITNDLTKKSDQLIHPDLRAAFDRLKPHLVLICEQKEDQLIKDSLYIAQIGSESSSLDDFDVQLLDHVDVSGFVISGSNEHLGVTLIGSKSVDCGTLNLISPFTKYESDYKHGLDLAEAIQACVYEVEQYLFEGKCAIAEPTQLEIEFNDEDELNKIHNERMVSNSETVLKAVKKKLKKDLAGMMGVDAVIQVD